MTPAARRYPIESARLTAAAVLGIALLLFLIIRSKLHAFVALLFASLLIGVTAGMPLHAVIQSVTNGMGGTLGTIAVLVGLGAMFGQMLHASGGAEQMADALLKRFGEKRAGLALSIAGFIIAVPVFFDVGFIILVPTIYGLGQKTGKSLVHFGLPLLAGLAVTHAFLPPTPGPIAVAGILGADVGLVILFGAIAGIPAMIIAGPLYTRFVAPRITSDTTNDLPQIPTTPRTPAQLPSVSISLVLTSLPLLLILIGTVTKATLPDDNTLLKLFTFIGHPFVALIITVLLAFYYLGKRLGMDGERIRGLATKALEPAGIIILVTGAGGVLKQVLIDSGVGKVIATGLATSAIPPILSAFIIAAILRLMQGSATVAMLSAAALMGGFLEGVPLSSARLALVVIAIAAGASTTSHVNDSGFWLVNRYLKLSVPDTLRTWTVATTLIALVGLIVTLSVSVIIP